MKGIILAGGLGSRLHPLTQATSKQLLPIYDKPMIYYPLSVLMLAGIHEICIISTPEDLANFKTLFGCGSHLGLEISYVAQKEPRGIAEAFILAEKFIGQERVALVLGDNIFYGNGLVDLLQKAVKRTGATVFGYAVHDPERYGVLSFDPAGKVLDLVEKPSEPPSPYAVTGLYFYDPDVVDVAKSLTPSERGELEITDVNRYYLKQERLRVEIFDRGFAWLDTGTPEALMEASMYVYHLQKRQGVKIACLEEIAYETGRITREAFCQLASQYSKSAYGTYLQKVAEGMLS